MSLQDKLDAMREKSESDLPPESVKTMHQATEDLRRSDIMSRLPKVGDKAPGFSLPDAQGNPVVSSELLKRGPLAVCFYRGVW